MDEHLERLTNEYAVVGDSVYHGAVELSSDDCKIVLAALIAALQYKDFFHSLEQAS